MTHIFYIYIYVRRWFVVARRKYAQIFEFTVMRSNARNLLLPSLHHEKLICDSLEPKILCKIDAHIFQHEIIVRKNGDWFGEKLNLLLLVEKGTFSTRYQYLLNIAGWNAINSFTIFFSSRSNIFFQFIFMKIWNINFGKGFDWKTTEKCSKNRQNWPEMKSITEEMKNHFRSAISIVGATAKAKLRPNFWDLFV